MRWWQIGKRRRKQPAVEFERPEGWGSLDGSPAAPQAPTPMSTPDPAPEPLDGSPAAPQAPTPMSTPDPAPEPEPRPAPPPEPAPSSPEPRHVPNLPPRRHRRTEVASIVTFIVLALIAGWLLVDRALEERPSRPSLSSERNPAPRATVDAPTVWTLSAVDLRPDLAAGIFESSIDGFLDDAAIIDAGSTWAVITLGDDGGDNRLHGLDASTGEELWTRDLEGAYCSPTLLRDHIACAEATAWEQGQGTGWTLHLLSPETGETTVSAEYGGWVAGIAVDQDHLILLEQRLPAPHAVVTGFDGELNQAWQLDLSGVEGHDGLFSENRVWVRAERFPEGPALDRPRFRRVGDGLSALWIGTRTVFIDAATGELKGMPFCSRLVDDGSRLWCNDGPVAMAYDYDLRFVTRTERGVRLAFPKPRLASGQRCDLPRFPGRGRHADARGQQHRRRRRRAPRYRHGRGAGHGGSADCHHRRRPAHCHGPHEDRRDRPGHRGGPLGQRVRPPTRHHGADG
ncbi:PQQ-binding-like beta-propeller repeat protein [Tessaracoccus massiliensis]|uniref:PQQ-binding-like beta-propeller repeat protein n=1 Tax=Tessaracoccus massiliensis TaxID=1522311 RepID=UPI00058C40F0|nr:PQQ-binding-like beta-propeller repeat protein [Tessaracoccus massiliensis]